MRLFALIIFGIHTVFELVFGASAFIGGGPSSLSAEEIAAQSTSLTISFRFMGAALLSLGVMGAIVLFLAGVQSATAHHFAIGFTVFHGLGALGSIYTAAPVFEVYNAPLTMGALVVHGSLALGFLVIALRKPA